MLAALIAGAPDVVSTDSLVAALGEGEPPAAPLESLRDSVSRLRHCLEPHLPPHASGHYVVRRGSGYALLVGSADIDARRLESLAARGAARLADREAAEAVRLLSAALHLWHGEPYAEWPDAPFGRSEPEEPSAWLDRACAVVARDLTPAEWERFVPDRPYGATCTDLL